MCVWCAFSVGHPRSNYTEFQHLCYYSRPSFYSYKLLRFFVLFCNEKIVRWKSCGNQRGFLIKSKHICVFLKFIFSKIWRGEGFLMISRALLIVVPSPIPTPLSPMLFPGRSMYRKPRGITQHRLTSILVAHCSPYLPPRSGSHPWLLLFPCDCVSSQ